MPSPRAFASGLLLAAALLGGAAPPAAAQEDPDREEFFPAFVIFEPFDRSAPAGSEVRLKFRLKSGLRTPVLVVVFPDGASSYVRPDVSRGYEHEIPFRLDRLGGTHRVSLFGFDASGERLAARFNLEALGRDGRRIDRDVDLPAADTPYASLDPLEHPLRLERFCFHRMNALRRRQGLEPLPWHEGVARSARPMLEEAARHWEETFDARLGYGQMLHRVPGAGPGGTEGPTLADRVRMDLAWPVVHPRLPEALPKRGRGNPNYVSESLSSADDSLERKFEQVFLRKSFLRAPMVSENLTHAAGAATWRWYGWKPGASRIQEPGPPPKGQARAAFAALVFVQVNDPVAAASYEKERSEVRVLLAAASTPDHRAAAYRRLGQAAFPESPRSLEEAAGKTKDPFVLAGALDGLWLCAPAAALRLTGPLRLRAGQALEDREESRAAADLRTLALLRYDAASFRAGTAGLEEAAKRIREVVAAAKAGAPDAGRALLAEATVRFAGIPGEEEIRTALRMLGGTGGAPPPK